MSPSPHIFAKFSFSRGVRTPLTPPPQIHAWLKFESEKNLILHIAIESLSNLNLFHRSEKKTPENYCRGSKGLLIINQKYSDSLEIRYTFIDGKLELKLDPQATTSTIESFVQNLLQIEAFIKNQFLYVSFMLNCDLTIDLIGT